MKCKAKCEVYSRVVGYYRPVQQWNRGKQEEYRQRRPFRLNVGAHSRAPVPFGHDSGRMQCAPTKNEP